LFAAVSAKSSDTAPEITGVGATTATASSAVASVADESAKVATATVIKVLFIFDFPRLYEV
jgi:hypothetical protein